MKADSTDTTIMQLDPSSVLADTNIRFGLKDTGIDALAASILAEGRILEPVGVVKLDPPQKNKLYRLVYGFYRLAAVEKLNKESAAGLTLPAMELEPSDEATRTRTQIAENVARESMSPMDRAVAAHKLMELGVSRMEIRQLFSVSAGKGGAQPLSNAMLNIMLRWLELPKTIQAKIHQGIVGPSAAYELGKVPPDKRQAVLDRAEASRLAEIKREEADEEKYLKEEQKLSAAKETESQALGEVETIKADIEKADGVLKAKSEELKAAQKTAILELSEEEKKAFGEKFKALQTDVKSAQKVKTDAQNKLAKVLTKAKTAAEAALEQTKKLEEARKAVRQGKSGSGKKKDVSGADIKKAAAAEGVGGLKALSLSEVRDAFKDVAEQKHYPKVQAIGKLIRECVNGKWTPKELIDEMALITGERQAPSKPAPAPAPVPTPAAAPKVKPAKK